MKIIGVTGSSGAGKTSVCKILKEKYHISIIDADEVARELSKKGNLYLQAIANEFGEGILDENGELKRKELAKLIYEQEEKRSALNHLTFIYVVKEIKKRIAELANEKTVAIDAALLFESELDKICDTTIGLVSTEEDKIERICKRDGISEEMAKKRLAIQMLEEELKKRVNYVIVNDGSELTLEKEIEKIISKVIE